MEFDVKLVSALGVTLRVALAATVLVAPLALATGWVLARRSFPGKSFVETLVALPLVLPPTAIGYLLLVVFGRAGVLGERNLGFDPGILFTWRGAVVASAFVAFPLAARSARAAFEIVDPRLERMGRSLGMSPAAVFARVTVPLAGRGLLAALALAFGRALGEFGATVIVAGNIPGRTQTLALAIFDEIQLGDERGALTFVGVACVLAFVVMWTVERLGRPRAAA
ncbi:MAG: molybdate ABC transporter permease subunit [Planctomycetota bacterium]|nr:molybdate ABC transporter permease subunit [Planctomycetota bacterium]